MTKLDMTLGRLVGDLRIRRRMMRSLTIAFFGVLVGGSLLGPWPASAQSGDYRTYIAVLQMVPEGNDDCTGGRPTNEPISLDFKSSGIYSASYRAGDPLRLKMWYDLSMAQGTTICFVLDPDWSPSLTVNYGYVDEAYERAWNSALERTNRVKLPNVVLTFGSGAIVGWEPLQAWCPEDAKGVPSEGHRMTEAIPPGYRGAGPLSRSQHCRLSPPSSTGVATPPHQMTELDCLANGGAWSSERGACEEVLAEVAPPAPPLPEPPREPPMIESPRCGRIIGDWVDPENRSIAFLADGTLTYEPEAGRRSWSCSDGSGQPVVDYTWDRILQARWFLVQDGITDFLCPEDASVQADCLRRDVVRLQSDPTNPFDRSSGFVIRSIQYPRAIVSGGARGDVRAFYGGEPAFPITIVLRPRSCESGFSCATETRIVTVPEGSGTVVGTGMFYCRGLAAGEVWNMDYELVLSDANGLETDPDPTPTVCSAP